MVRGFKARAERIAVDVRKQLALTPEDPLPADTLAKLLNVRLLHPKDIPGVDQVLLRSLSDSRNGFSAIHFRCFEKRFVVTNPSHQPARAESNVMHELAHVLCEHCGSGLVDFPPLGLMLKYDEEQEEQAKFLGGCLQIPKDGLLKHLFAGREPQEIADHYGASSPMVKYRLFASGAGVIFKRAMARPRNGRF